MRAVPLVVNFHNESAPIYSAHFEPHGKGRLATGGGDNNVRLWRLEAGGEDRQISYLATLVKHTQAVNVVRFCPRGEMLASAGDDGNVLLWVPSEMRSVTPALGEDGLEDKESWRIKHMCRSSGSEIYDLAWSPDGLFFITGSMDNVARIYETQTGKMVRQIAEHSHYVQGVAWDPLNEFVATQSSDRSVHIYALKTKDGQPSLHGKISRMDLPSRRISSNSPAPPEIGPRAQHVADASSLAIASPTPSAPGTPTSLPLPMNPPALTPSRRSSFSSSPSLRRSMSPAPSLPLPAVKPMESSPKVHSSGGMRNANIYANESLTSFFRRLTFTPDGSLLFTPAGQYKVPHPVVSDGSRTVDDVINTVYIYTRAGFHKPPIAHLPAHKKPSIAVRCSPVLYTLRKSAPPTKHITVDTASGEDSLSALPEPAVPSKAPTTTSTMEPPSLESTNQTFTDPSQLSAGKLEPESASSGPGPTPAFALPYRVVYAVATQDAVLIYDTQQQTPLCIVSNLHYATFTDLTWSMDGLTLIMSSSDGFCSAVAFMPGELGQVYNHVTAPTPHLAIVPSASSSAQSTPAPTPVSAHAHPLSRQASNPNATSLPSLPARPSSPARSSFSASAAPPRPPTPSQPTVVVVNQAAPPKSENVSGTDAINPSSNATGTLPLTTPPQTPMAGNDLPAVAASASNTLGKRDSGVAVDSRGEAEETTKTNKRRKIEPTIVSAEEDAGQSK